MSFVIRNIYIDRYNGWETKHKNVVFVDSNDSVKMF